MKKCTLVLMLLSLLLSGCGEQEALADREVNIFSEKETGSTYEMTQVVRATVAQTLPVDCVYSQTEEYELFFGVDDEIVANVYVEKGDSVKKGELLASVDLEKLEKQKSELTHQLASAQLQLAQLQESLAFELEQAQTLFYYTFMKDDDKKRLKEQKESIEASFRDSIADAQDIVTIMTARLQETKAYLEGGSIYAPIDGVMSMVMSELEGSLTDKTRCVMRLYDADSILYHSQNVEAIPYIDPEAEYTITCGLGKAMRQYTVKPANMDSWGEELYFKLLDEEYDPNNVVKGRIVLNTQVHERALCLDRKALHTSGEKYYVYVLDEQQIRRMRYVTTGLWSEDTVEILEGLAEGENVILK